MCTSKPSMRIKLLIRNGLRSIEHKSLPLVWFSVLRIRPLQLLHEAPIPDKRLPSLHNQHHTYYYRQYVAQTKINIYIWLPTTHSRTLLSMHIGENNSSYQNQAASYRVLRLARTNEGNVYFYHSAIRSLTKCNTYCLGQQPRLFGWSTLTVRSISTS